MDPAYLDPGDSITFPILYPLGCRFTVKMVNLYRGYVEFDNGFLLPLDSDLWKSPSVEASHTKAK
jgi:hypothetical protein